MTITGVFDAIKYRWNCIAIRKAGTARGQSRKFINTAIVSDLVKLTYGIVRLDVFIIFSALIALFFMLEQWITVYRYYPYKNRGLLNFKRPSLWVYFINSILPNNLRRRL